MLTEIFVKVSDRQQIKGSFSGRHNVYWTSGSVDCFSLGFSQEVVSISLLVNGRTAPLGAIVSDGTMDQPRAPVFHVAGPLASVFSGRAFNIRALAWLTSFTLANH